MTAPARARRRRILSPLTRRILFLNLIGPALLGVGLLYLDEYRDGLIEAQRAPHAAPLRLLVSGIVNVPDTKALASALSAAAG